MLQKELNKIAANIPSGLGGGADGHLGLILSDTKYQALTGGTDFVKPAHPGHYPQRVSAGAATRACEEAEHRAAIKEFEVCVGVESGLKFKICEAVDEVWFAKLEDEELGLLQHSAIELMAHLFTRNGEMDFVETTALERERDEPWNPSEHIATYFNTVETAKRNLAKAGITTCTKSLVNKALTSIKASGDFTLSLREWKDKPDADQTWENLKTFFSKEYAKKARNEGLTARDIGFGNANNAVESKGEVEAEYAAATLEVIQQVT